MSASLHHFAPAATRRPPIGAVQPAPTFRPRDFEMAARAIGAARAARDLSAGTLPAGIDDLDWWHLSEITGDPAMMMPPEEYRLLVGWADGGYWSEIDDSIPEQPDTRAAKLADETVDFSWIKIVRPCWRARMDETLCILLDEAADERHWTAAKFCAAYALLAGPADAARVFEDLL